MWPVSPARLGSGSTSWWRRRWWRRSTRSRQPGGHARRGGIALARPTVASYLLDSLAAYGVTHVFGLPGDSIDTILDPIRRHPDLTYIQVRHEEAGAFMASAQAKLTGRPAACLGTSGPGAIHLLNGLYDARLDGAPVIALTGQVATERIGSDYFQEINLERLFDDVSVYNQRVMTPAQAPTLIDRALAVAVARGGVSHLTFPFDIPRHPLPEDHRPQGPLPALVQLPSDAALNRAADVLNHGERIAILAGRGALAAAEPLRDIALRLGAPVVHTLPAKGVLPDDDPHLLGGLGLTGARPAHTAIEQCDTLLMVGTSYPYLEFLPRSASVVQIDRLPERIGKRIPVSAPLLGDARATLEALLPLLPPRQPTSWLDHLQHERADWLAFVRHEGSVETAPLRPQFIAHHLSRLMPDDAVLTMDVGNALVWMARHFEIRHQRFLMSAWLGSMGFGLPAAIGAKLALPDRPVVAVVGDGGFAMLMADFLTAVKYELPIVVVVLRNGKLAMIKFEQEVIGYPEWGVDLVNPDFARFADISGGLGLSVETPDAFAPAFEKALAAGKPAILDVATDPDVPPMPPRLTIGEAANYATALFKETFGG